MEEWKTGHLHAFIRIMTQELLEGNDLTELSCKSGIYQESGPKGPDF